MPLVKVKLDLGTLFVEIIEQLHLQLPMQLVFITTKVAISNPVHNGCTQYHII